MYGMTDLIVVLPWLFSIFCRAFFFVFIFGCVLIFPSTKFGHFLFQHLMSSICKWCLFLIVNMNLMFDVFLFCNMKCIFMLMFVLKDYSEFVLWAEIISLFSIYLFMSPKIQIISFFKILSTICCGSSLKYYLFFSGLLWPYTPINCIFFISNFIYSN